MPYKNRRGLDGQAGRTRDMGRHHVWRPPTSKNATFFPDQLFRRSGYHNEYPVLYSQHKTSEIRHNVNIDVSKTSFRNCHVIILDPLYTFVTSHEGNL